MRILLLLAMIGATHQAQAALHCSTNIAELRVNLALAQASAADDEVRVASGTYGLDASIVFEPVGATPTGSLVVSGGWNAFCTQQQRGAQWTKFESAVPNVVFSIVADGDVLLSDMHLVNVTMGLRSTLETPAINTVQLTRVAVFTDTGVGDAINIFTPADRITFDNVLVDAFAGCGVAAASFSEDGRFEIFSSTLISRSDFGSAVCFDGAPEAKVNGATNSVFAAPNGNGVAILSNGLPALLRFSAYTDALGCEFCDPPVLPLHPDSVSNFEQVMPFAATATGDLARFTRVANATALIPNLRDSGPPDHAAGFDILGTMRIVGGRVDRGAFELPEESGGNTAPSIVGPATQNILEDGATDTFDVTLADTETAPADLALVATSDDDTLVANGGILLGGSGAGRTGRVTPLANQHGTATITMTVTDGGGLTDTIAFDVVIAPVNDRPSFTLRGDVVHAANTGGAQTSPGFVTGTAFGPNELDQTAIAYTVNEVSDAAGILSGAAIATDGTLSYTLSGEVGTATLSATLQDSGGVMNGGVDTSSAVQFTITVSANSIFSDGFE